MIDISFEFSNERLDYSESFSAEAINGKEFYKETTFVDKCVTLNVSTNKLYK